MDKYFSTYNISEFRKCYIAHKHHSFTITKDTQIREDNKSLVDLPGNTPTEAIL